MIVIHKDRLRCPTCDARMTEALNINGLPSTFWMKCTKCETYIDTYIPMEHQKLIHADPTRIVGVFGGYGSGKTVTNFKDDEKHILLTPQGETLMGAKTIPQLDVTIRKDFESDMPRAFVRHYNKQKNTITFINSHIVYYKPLNDEGNLRSMNLTRYHILEASVAGHDKFVQLNTRLRNLNATIPERDDDGNLVWEEDPNNKGKKRVKIALDWRKGIIESNPDSGWIRDDVLLKSGKIYVFGDTDQEYYVNPEDAQPTKVSYIIPTNANYMLPPGFIEELRAGRPKWWQRRYLYGSFDYAEGLVYPEAMSCFKPVKPLPKGAKRMISMDYGLRDNTHFIFTAWDEERRKIIVYDELVIEGMNIKEISAQYKKKLDNIPSGAIMKTPVMDGRSINVRSKETKRTLGELFLDEGLLFEPAQMELNPRILKLNTLIETGQIEIYQANCPLLCKELLNYKFPDRELDVTKKSDDKPQDVNNHGVNSLEFNIMEYPWDLKQMDLGVFGVKGKVSAYANSLLEKKTPKRYNPLAPQFTGYGDSYDTDETFDDLY